MQNTGKARIAVCDAAQGRTRQGPLSLRARFSLVAFLAACACALLLVAASPSSAQAKSYEMPDVNIAATVTDSGDLHVVETRHFSFNGSYSAVWWTFSNLPDNASLQVNSVSAKQYSSGGADAAQSVDYPEVAFQTRWRSSGGPSGNAYSVDTAENTAYVFFSAADEDLVVTFDYTVVNGVTAYQDVGDLYWQFVTANWAEDSQNVTCTVTLPAPDESYVPVGEDVRAWGHGALDGTVSIGDDGTVTYHIPRVSSGSYAEARIVFPTAWLTNLSGAATSHLGETHLASVLSEEQAWADQANSQRVASLIMLVVPFLITIGLIVWALLVFRKWGREFKPEFQEKYWRDVPEKGCHPAIVSRNWNWNTERQEDFTATLMHLSAEGAITINKGSYEKKGLVKAKQVDDYYLTRVPAVADKVTDPIDKAALDFLFTTIAAGEDALWFGTIEAYGEKNPEDFSAQMTAWQGMVTAEVNKADFFEAKSARKKTFMKTVAFIYLFIGVAFFFVFSNFIPAIASIICFIALFIIAHFTSRRTRHGVELYAHSEALKNWLKDFSRLSERPPTDVKVWGEFMVYAYLFGIADEVMKELQTAVPALFEDDAMMAGTYYMPWWIWYSPGFSGMPAAGDMFATTMSNTTSTVAEALSAAGDDFSSGGGFGGGFSMGGGGGFGGGGGAR